MAALLIAVYAFVPTAHAQPLLPPEEGGTLPEGVDPSAGGLVGELFGQKNDLELKDTINYEACFDYSESMSITFSPKCLFSKFPPVPAPVFRYKAKHTEPTAIVELTLEPGGGALKASAPVGDIVGQGSLQSLAGLTLGGGVGTKTYVGNTNPNMPTLGRIPSIYFDGHVWGVGPLGLLDAGKGGVEEQGGGRMNALKSMICWLADASEYWAPIPFKASGHLALISPAAEGYIRYFLGDWGNRWYNKAGSAQVSATTATSFVNGFGDVSAFGLAAVGALVGHAIASDDGAKKCEARAATDRAQQQANQARLAAEQSQPKLEQLAPKATYLPAGYDQVNAGYDTCPLTGSGHYVDEETNQVAFSNCDPQERIIQLDCQNNIGRFVPAAPGHVTAVMNPYENPCATGAGQSFLLDPYTYIRAPSCKNRLSGFQQNGRFLACNDQSQTYASCGQRLTGRARLKDGHSAGETGTQEGAFELCLQPQGQKVVDHLGEHNAYLSNATVENAQAYARGVDVASKALDENLQQNNIQCTTEGKNSGVGGAAAGAAVGFGVAKGINYLKNNGTDIGGIFGGGEGNSETTSRIGEGIQSVQKSITKIFGDIKVEIQSTTLVRGFNNATKSVSAEFGAIKGEVTGTLNDFTQDNGLGSLTSLTSDAGAILALNGSLSSITNFAEHFNLVPDWLGSAVLAFNQDRIIPLYLSEQDVGDWRDENPASKASRISALQKVPLAPDVSLFGKNLAGFNCGEVGSWGQLCPLRGFVETSGNKFPASALAGWRAYHKALPKVPDRKRMKDKPTRFNLDYPHQTACYDVGDDSDEWESRRDSAGGGLLGKVFGSSGSGISSIFDAGNAGASLGGLFGTVEDKRAATGVFVYTYWKDTKCSWDVCTSPLSGLGLGDLAGIPGLESLQGVADQVNNFKKNLPGADILKNSATFNTLKGLPGASVVGGFAKNKALGAIPGAGIVGSAFGAAGAFDGSAGESGGESGGGSGNSLGGGQAECQGVGPLLSCGNTGNSSGGTPPSVVPDYLQNPDTLNGSFGAISALPGSEALTDLISNLPPVSLPKLGNLGKILKFKNEE